MKTILIKIVKAYRKYISPVKRPSCRFFPTCSEYSLEALEKYGALKGSWMSIKRILRCNPFYRGAIYDPVDQE
ncbi:MAG: membrane protein insertion efficiency factor YidD [Clostridiaceae bacterium]